MIEERVIDSYSKNERDAIVDALRTLSQFGVLTRQIHFNNQTVVESFTGKSATELAEQILQVQQTNRQLLALHEVAGNLKKED
jgi:hypothetical protein